ncbi:MAG: SMC family ATPase [Methanoregula sp.]|uniref:AAA family ATPase n=1 Tax=Methanoregula sp. TaxID=2052170 RepID=UPI003BB0C7C0
MIIDRLTVRNFKRFRNETIEFTDGITGILGNNGTGKSSIVQAIFFALYGVRATGIAPEYIVSSFAAPKDKCEVKLEFSVGGEHYTVIRTFKKGKSVQHDAEFYRNGKLVAKEVGPVEAEVRRTLGMGPVDFKNTIYAGQKDLLTLLESTPGKRKEWFLKALGIDYLSAESQKILKERVDAAESGLRLLEGELIGIRGRQNPEDLPRLHAELMSTRTQIAAYEKERASLTIKKDTVYKAIREFNAQRDEHTRRTETKNTLVREMTGLRHQQDDLAHRLTSLSAREQECRSLEAQVAAYPEKKRQLENLRNLKGQVDRLTAEQQFARQQCGDLSIRIAKHQEQVAEIRKDAEKADKLRAEIRTGLRIVGTVPDANLETLVAAKNQEIDRSLGTFGERQKRLEKDQAKLISDRDTLQAAGENGTCPLCRQKLGEHYTEIEQEFASQLAVIQDEAITVLASWEKLKKEKSVLESIVPKLVGLRKYAEAQARLPAIEKELADLLKTLHEKETAEKQIAEKMRACHFDIVAFTAIEKAVTDLEKVQTRYNELARQLAQAGEIQTQLTAVKTRIAENEAAQKETDALIARNPFDPAHEYMLEEQLAQVTEAQREADTGHARATEQVRHAEEKIATIKSEQAKLAELEVRIKAASEEIELLKLTRSIIAEYVVYLMQVVRNRIEGEVSRIVSEITGGRYEQVLLDDDFNLSIRDIDADYAIDRFSGGEQDDIAVALRIALSRYLAELHNVHESTLLIFDEIFGSQDEERRNNLLTALRTQESRFPQIILISHIPEMQGEFETTLVVEMGADLASRVRVVE